MNNSDNFHGYPAFKDIFISVRGYNARIKDLSVQFDLFNFYYISLPVPYRNANSNTTLE